jgi:hypothetical protein
MERKRRGKSEVGGEQQRLSVYSQDECKRLAGIFAHDPVKTNIKTALNPIL